MLRCTHAAWLCIVALLILTPACNGGKGTAAGGKSTGELKSGPTVKPKGHSVLVDDHATYPIDWDDRPYTDLNPSVLQAWFLTENAYVIVKNKWLSSKGDVRKNVEKELDKSVFAVNDKVKQLFEDGIKAEPDNPLNYCSYAMYLKPRKYLKDGGYINAYPDAIKNVDKAIELWPDETRFYLLKIWIITAPNVCHDWVRAGIDDRLAAAAALPDMIEMYDKAEQYDPDNANINYEKACKIFRYTDPAKFDDIKDDLLREIRAGNQKSQNLYYFPPPLQPHYNDAALVVLSDAEEKARFYDAWSQFGSLSSTDVQGIIAGLADRMEWPKDKQDVTDVMFFAYNVGRCKPYDRSYFAMQHYIMTKVQEKAQTSGDADVRRKLADASRYLAEQMKSIAREMLAKKLLKDSTKMDAAGVEEVENGGLRQNNLRDMIQPHQAAYLKRFGEIMGVDFPLDPDPSKW